MAIRITEECITCGACEPECENKAISEGEPTYIIDPDKCTECVGISDTPKCAEVCSVDCCKPDPNRVESYEQLLAKWQKLHPGQTPTKGLRK
ncbi:MAG: YfhL family 4Fe-4S dicluster ferredoxin [Chloroflexi bacterium]|nr:YfhL family 4Fe-4S dicluster ferredoxin [Chloroflexota bacterium]